MNQNQRFAINEPLELRSSHNGPTEIVGYAAVFYNATDKGTEFRPAPTIVERIMPTAFESSLSGGHDIVATFDHNSERILGRTSTGTLRISTDQRGLRFSIPYQPGDPDHELVAGKISRKLLTGASFTFSLPDGGEQIRHERHQTVRELHAVDLIELGPVSMPAYSGSDAALRCAAGWDGFRQQKSRIERMREITSRLRGLP